LDGEVLGKATYSPRDKEGITENEKIAVVLPRIGGQIEISVRILLDYAA
jgi:hypothetical protein